MLRYIALCSILISAVKSTCETGVFPISWGGRSEETVTCSLYHEWKNIHIVAGTSNSDDFVPAASNHGYVMAFDNDGNVLANYFNYNVSYALSEISGCAFSDD